MTLSQELKSYGISSLWNVTHLSNLESLLSHGIICRNLVCNLPNFTDISDPVVQSRRRRAYDSNRKVFFDPHDYVPLFFTDNTPMLYVTLCDDKMVILLEVSPEVADSVGVYFSDGNIASSDSCCYTDPNDLKNLDWSIIKSQQGAFWKEWRRKRAAEVLIPKSCPPSFIKAVHVQDAVVEEVKLADAARAIVRKFGNLNIDVHEDLTPEGVRPTPDLSWLSGLCIKI